MSAEDLKLRAVRCFLLLGICAVAGVVLLFGVYLLPTEPMKRNAADALSIMQQEGPMHRLIPDIEASRIDNYTDSVMLNESDADIYTQPMDRSSWPLWLNLGKAGRS